MVSISLLVLNLITLTTADGRQVQVNPEDIVSFRAPHGASDHFSAGVKCVVYTVDGKFIAVKETCDQVGKMLAPDGGTNG